MILFHVDCFNEWKEYSIWNQYCLEICQVYDPKYGAFFLIYLLFNWKIIALCDNMIFAYFFKELCLAPTGKTMSTSIMY